MSLKVRPARKRLPSALLVGMLLLGLAACEKGKPRHPPFDPMAIPPPAAPDQAPPPVKTEGLPKRPESPVQSLDRIGAANDPANQQPAITQAALPIVFAGFAYDAVAKAPAKGVDIAIDGTPYGTTYGANRADVAAYFKTPAVRDVGFIVTVPAGRIPAGAHTAQLRVVAADGHGYFAGPVINFQVQ